MIRKYQNHKPQTTPRHPWSAHQRLRSDAQADLSLRWANIPTWIFCWTPGYAEHIRRVIVYLKFSNQLQLILAKQRIKRWLRVLRISLNNIYINLITTF